MRSWRQNASANTDRHTRAERLRVREFRSAGWHLDAHQAKEAEAHKETAEAEQVQGLAFSLSAPLAFGSLSLLPFSGQPIPRQATASNLRAHDTEPFSVRQFASVVAKRLLVKITEEVEWFHADVRALKLPLNHAPEIFHRIRVDVSISVLNRVVNHGVFVIRGKPIVGLQRIAEQCATGLNVLLDVLVEFMLPASRDCERSDLPATFHHSQSDSFVLAASAGNDLLTARPMHVAGLAAYKRFVNPQPHRPTS